MLKDVTSHEREIFIGNLSKQFGIKISKSEANDENLFEKAKHQVGDVHPSGKWVWTDLGNGRFDWRSAKGRKAGGAGNAGNTGNAGQAGQAGGAGNAEKDTIKQIPYKNLKKVSQVIDYAKTLSDFTFKEEKSKWGKDGKAFSLTNKNGLTIFIDFLNDHEYFYSFYDGNNKKLYGVDDSIFCNNTNWKEFLNPEMWSTKKTKQIYSIVSKKQRQSTIFLKRYFKNRDAIDHMRYKNLEQDIESFYKDLEGIKKIAELS